MPLGRRDKAMGEGGDDPFLSVTGGLLLGMGR